jgi:hypothetical protein
VESSAAIVARVLLCDELPVPSKQRIRGDEGPDLHELLTTRLFRKFGETPPSNVRETKALSAQLFSERSVLFLEIVDHILLGSIHPAGQNQCQELKRESVHSAQSQVTKTPDSCSKSMAAGALNYSNSLPNRLDLPLAP